MLNVQFLKNTLFKAAAMISASSPRASVCLYAPRHKLINYLNLLTREPDCQDLMLISILCSSHI